MTWLMLVAFALALWNIAGRPPVWTRAYWYLSSPCGWCGYRTTVGGEWLCQRCIERGVHEWM